MAGGRDLLARIFLGGRDPAEQRQRVAQQKIDAGLAPAGAAGTDGASAGAPPLDMTQPGPWGAGIDQGTTGASVPTPRPRPSPSMPAETSIIPQPRPTAPGVPDVLSPPGLGGVPPDLMAQQMPGPQLGGGVPPDLMSNSIPGAPPLMGVPPDLRGGGVPVNDQPRQPGFENGPIGSIMEQPIEISRGFRNAPIGSISQNAQPRAPAKPKKPKTFKEKMDERNKKKNT